MPQCEAEDLYTRELLAGPARSLWRFATALIQNNSEERTHRGYVGWLWRSLLQSPAAVRVATPVLVP